MSGRSDIRIGITMGDPSGIGPEIIAAALPRLKGVSGLTVIGDMRIFEKVTGPRSRYLKKTAFFDMRNVSLAGFSSGRISAEYGRASVEYLEQAMKMLSSGSIDAIVTCPISKEAINLAGFSYSGHTEYFAEKTGNKNAVMMLLNRHIKFSLVTRHIPLDEISRKLTKEKIKGTIRITQKALKTFFGIKKPRLCLCGINPHGSDNGLIGDQENKVIRPAVIESGASAKGVYGPFGADIAINRTYKKDFDCVIAMYHDQALIPLKLLGDDTGVNLTLGLDFIRTSPLHGTAFDIAGKNIADPSSLIAAVKTAYQCTINQRKA